MWFFFFDDDPQQVEADPSDKWNGIGLGYRIEFEDNGMHRHGYVFHLQHSDKPEVLARVWIEEKNAWEEWFAVVVDDIKNPIHGLKLCGEELSEWAEQYYTACQWYFEQNGVYPFPFRPGFDTDLAEQLDNHMESAKTPTYHEKKNGRKIKIDHIGGLASFRGTFELIAYYQPWFPQIKVYHCLVKTIEGYRDVHVDFKKRAIAVYQPTKLVVLDRYKFRSKRDMDEFAYGTNGGDDE